MIPGTGLFWLVVSTGLFAVWKLSKYVVFSGPNTGKYTFHAVITAGLIIFHLNCKIWCGVFGSLFASDIIPASSKFYQKFFLSFVNIREKFKFS